MPERKRGYGAPLWETPRPAPMRPPPPSPPPSPPPPPKGRPGGLGALLGRGPGGLETEDLLVLLILYLLYRESGDTELLFIGAAFLLG